VTDDGERTTPGKGLINGLAVTFKTMTRRSTTQQYPDVQPDLPPRSRGVIALLEENCTVCMLCARECPDWCIYIDSHKEEVVVPGAARPRQRNVLDKFDIDFALCMYCGICIEVCPFDALHWTPEFEYAELDVLDLLHDKNRLGDWMQSVPPPPAHDVLGEPSKEEATAARKAVGPGAPTAAKTARPAPVRPTPTPTASTTPDDTPQPPVEPAS
jgi:NADH-quinone oxidoreductase subunit I